MNHGIEFLCPECKQEGRTVNEEGKAVQNSQFWKEVRIYWNYDPVTDEYRATSIVRDESLWGSHGIYYLWNPMIRTERRSVSTAERMLANLQNYSQVGDEVPGQLEQTLDFSKSREEFQKDLTRVAKSWEGLKANNLPKISE